MPPGEGFHVRLQLGAYVLGALTPEEDRQVAVHLQECEACGTEYLDMAEAPYLLAMLTEADLLEGLDSEDGEDGERA